MSVPVAAARDIARSFAKDVVVIVAYDNAHERLHTTTYGRDPLDKVRAADLGEVLAKAAGGDVSRGEYSEDFRQPALRAQRIDELLAAAEEVSDQLRKRGVGDHLPTVDPLATCIARLRSATQAFKSGKPDDARIDVDKQEAIVSALYDFARAQQTREHNCTSAPNDAPDKKVSVNLGAVGEALETVMRVFGYDVASID